MLASPTDREALAAQLRAPQARGDYARVTATMQLKIEDQSSGGVNVQVLLDLRTS